MKTTFIVATFLVMFFPLCALSREKGNTARFIQLAWSVIMAASLAVECLAL